MLGFKSALQRQASTSNHTEPRLWRPSPPALPRLQLQLLECSHNMPQCIMIITQYVTSWLSHLSLGTCSMFRIHPNPACIMVKVSLSVVKHLYLLELVEGTAAKRLRYHNAVVGGTSSKIFPCCIIICKPLLFCGNVILQEGNSLQSHAANIGKQSCIFCLPARAGPIKISPHDLPQLPEQNPWIRSDTWSTKHS